MLTYFNSRNQANAREFPPPSNKINFPPAASCENLPKYFQSVAPSKWPTPVVIIPANFKTWTGTPPWANQLPPFASLFVYQRTDQGAPNYSPNHQGGYEAGVHLQFLAEHWNNLPDVMVFTQQSPEEHNPDFFRWLGCLRPETLDYTSLNSLYIPFRDIDLFHHKSRKLGAVVEQCWRNVLHAFQVGGVLKPREKPRVSLYCCAQFAVSRQLVQRHVRESYCQARWLLANGVGNCHFGDLDWPTLSFERNDSLIVPRDSSTFNKHTSGAWEHLIHVIMGNQPLLGHTRTTGENCRNFLPSDQCPGSPANSTAVCDNLKDPTEVI